MKPSQLVIYIAGKTTLRPSGGDTQTEVRDCQAREPHPRPRGHRESGAGAVARFRSRARSLPRARPHAARALAQQPRRRHGPGRGLRTCALDDCCTH